MGWVSDVAKDVAKGVISTAVLGIPSLLWRRFSGSPPESFYQKALSPIALLQWQIWLWAAITVFLLAFSVFTLFRKRSAGGEAGSKNQTLLDPKIEIRTDNGAPYHIADVKGGHIESTVKVGIVNAGGGMLSNCKVYIEKISPPLNSPGGMTLLLDGSGFQLRHDDKEKLVEIAVHWDHHDKFRFSTPISGGFFDTTQWMDGAIRRTFALRVTATECERSALFEIWADESKRLHLKFVNYRN